MPQQITTAFSKMIAGIREFTVAQRTLALIGLAIIIVALVALGTWMSKPQLRPLFTDLAPSDASAIVDQLTSQGVEYELANSGSTIMVPADQVYDQRLKVASSGISPSQEGGYAILDNMGMSASEFQQDVAYKRALEGELAKTLGAMNGVETATVQLAMPAESVFVSEKQEASASVFVKPQSGTSFTDDQVQAMTHLVSSSVEGLPVANVSVIDANGNVLSNIDSENGNVAASKATLEYENRVASNVQGMLDRILGSGMAVVSVTADLDPSSTKRTSESFNSNENAQPLTERTTLEEYEGTRNDATGVLGPDNIAVPQGEGNNGNYTNETTERANAVDKVTEQTEIGPGAVSRQSVSVAVDQTAAATMNMADLQTMVASAAGINEERGDVVTVTRMAFDTKTAEAAAAAITQAEEAEAAAAQQQLIRNLAIAAIAFLVLIVLAIAANKRRKNNQEEEIFEDLPPLDLGELNLLEQQQNELAAAEALAQIEFPELPEIESQPDQAALMAERKRQDVVSLADEDPEQVADFIRELMETRAN